MRRFPCRVPFPLRRLTSLPPTVPRVRRAHSPQRLRHLPMLRRFPPRLRHVRHRGQGLQPLPQSRQFRRPFGILQFLDANLHHLDLHCHKFGVRLECRGNVTRRINGVIRGRMRNARPHGCQINRRRRHARACHRDSSFPAPCASTRADARFRRRRR